MEWLWHNPIAEMYGPQFLLFYACVSAATIALCAFAARRLDWTGRMPPPPLPPLPDPYEIAYLRGGENEVARTAVFALIRAGHLRVRQDGKKSLIERTGQPAPTTALGDMERSTYGWFDRPRESSEVFKSDGLAGKLLRNCAAYEQGLRRDKLLAPPEIEGRARQVRLAGLAVIAGLGGYKLLVALSNGRFNVVFLVLLGAVALVVLFKLCRAPRLSRRGLAHLERLRTAFDRLKDGGSTLTEVASNARDSADGHGGGPSRAGGLDPVLLTLGVFGATALAGADHANYAMAFKHSTATADSSGGSTCGSSCGSSDSSSSGGDSGGGGGSSCGSSCGGGCGGCGGGGD